MYSMQLRLRADVHREDHLRKVANERGKPVVKVVVLGEALRRPRPHPHPMARSLQYRKTQMMMT